MTDKLPPLTPELKQALGASMTADAQATMRQLIAQKIGRCVVALLSEWAPDVNLSMDVLVNLAASNAVANNIPLAHLQTGLHNSYKAQQKAQRRLEIVSDHTDVPVQAEAPAPVADSETPVSA